jgi:hypothetical protein
MVLEPWPELARLGHRARAIRDPVKRLRLLRKAMGGHLRCSLRPDVAPRPCGGRPPGPVVAALLLLASAGSVADAVRSVPPPPASPASRTVAAPGVWLVERTPEWELYSNGLRVELRLSVSTRPRLYRVLPRREEDHGLRWQTRPAGIVFHSSESELTSFVPEHTGWMKRQSLDLLAYAHRHHLYHYVVDRFGRVHRIVEESDVANHAGHSIWADSESIYLNLNASFLGVAFEARTGPGAEASDLSPAQVHAGKVLIDLLRCKYRIRPENCVAHAQVSVNPNSFTLGFHTDWVCGFPFRQLGLPDNYLQPPPSMSLFGFAYEAAFFDAADPSLRSALREADDVLGGWAAALGRRPAAWRDVLRRRYRQAAAEAATERAALEAPARSEVLQP